MSPQKPTETESNQSVANQLRSYFAQTALISIVVDRDEQDSYSIQIVPVNEEHSPRLREADVIALLPTGSRWLQAIGWHSYFGIPFSFEDKIWLAVGAEVVKEHRSRGAFVSSYAFIFPFHQPPSIQMAQFADELHAKGNRAKPANAGSVALLQDPLKFITSGLKKLCAPDDSYRVIKANSMTPAEHARVEAYIIREAAESYNRRELLLFRTLILSENQLEKRDSLFSDHRKKKTLARLQIHYYKYLVATVPVIKSSFLT